MGGGGERMRGVEEGGAKSIMTVIKYNYGCATKLKFSGILKFFLYFDKH